MKLRQKNIIIKIQRLDSEVIDLKTDNRKRKKHKTVYKSKATLVTYIILRLAVLIAMALSIVTKKYENLFVCVLALILFLLPSFTEKKFAIEVPSVLEVIILLFIFAAEILGEMNSFYVKYRFWDSMLHTINGFLCAAIGFAMVDILNRNSKIKFSLSPVYLAVAAFCFSMTIGVLWEFFEFSADMLLHTDMQKDTIVHTISSVALNPDGVNKSVIIKDISQVAVNGELLPTDGYIDIGLIDTMKDLFVNFIGAVVFSIIGYSYVKHNGKGKFARNFIPRLSSDFLEKEKVKEVSDSNGSDSQIQ